MLARDTAETKSSRDMPMKPLLKPSTVSATGKAQTGGPRKKGIPTLSSSARSTASTQILQGSSELAFTETVYVYLHGYDSVGHMDIHVYW
jgi:hypothetical protein